MISGNVSAELTGVNRLISKQAVNSVFNIRYTIQHSPRLLSDCCSLTSRLNKSYDQMFQAFNKMNRPQPSRAAVCRARDLGIVLSDSFSPLARCASLVPNSGRPANKITVNHNDGTTCYNAPKSQRLANLITSLRMCQRDLTICCRVSTFLDKPETQIGEIRLSTIPDIG